MHYTCGKCEYKTTDPAQDPACIEDRGYFWHRCCAMWFGHVIDFPSPGKMIPSTILHDTENA